MPTFHIEKVRFCKKNLPKNCAKYGSGSGSAARFFYTGRVFILQSVDFTNQAHRGRIAGSNSSIVGTEPQGAQLFVYAEPDPTKNNWNTKVKTSKMR